MQLGDMKLLPKSKTIRGIRFRLDKWGAYLPEFHEDIPPKVKIREPSDCLPFLVPIRNEIQEIFVVITLDGSSQLIRVNKITKGLVNQSQVHPRETSACALEDRAVNIIIAHNHPSGSLDPSTDDLVTTRRLADAGRLLGIPLIDHLIVGETGFISLKERFPEIFSKEQQ